MTERADRVRQVADLWLRVGCGDPCEDGLSALSATVYERDLQDWLKEIAGLYGWAYYHTRDSRGSDPGFPDTVLVKPPRVVLIEVKRQSRYHISNEQIAWMTMLLACPGVEATLLRPCCQDRVKWMLQDRVKEMEGR